MPGITSVRTSVPSQGLGCQCPWVLRALRAAGSVQCARVGHGTAAPRAFWSPQALRWSVGGGRGDAEGPPVPGPVVLVHWHPIVPAVASSCGIWPVEGFFLFRRGAVTGVLAPEAPDPTGGPWTPPGDGSGPAWASSPGRVAVGAHVTRQVGTAVSAVWQCHSAVTAAAREARAVPPSPQFTSRWGTAPGAGGGHSPPAPSRAADPSRGGQGDWPQPPASAPGTRRSPASRTESLCAGQPPHTSVAWEASKTLPK